MVYLRETAGLHSQVMSLKQDLALAAVQVVMAMQTLTAALLQIHTPMTGMETTYTSRATDICSAKSGDASFVTRSVPLSLKGTEIFNNKDIDLAGK